MMFKRFLLAVIMALAACEPRSAAPSTEVILLTATPEATEAAALPRWLETEVNGVSVGMWRPNNWETDMTDGLVLAEHTTSPSEPGEQGIIINCFVPPLEDYDPGEIRSNYAWAVLDWVIKMPDHTGWDVSVTQPVAFNWDQHQAAYYLFSTGDGVRGIVLAVAVPDEQKVVVINISAPMSQANRIRAALPGLLDGLMIASTQLNKTALETLPDPFPFPRYNRSSYTGGHGDPHPVVATAAR